ncbi:MAG: hypothetical protein GFGODING_01447 [Flavobacteriales bacterium]|nr:hypothetical protein [Flavobacteriales bacterium]NUQ14344.1 hypothetical protein [Flavobacteriales bacterium]
MKKRTKRFDAVLMVREIREAMYRKANDPDFEPKELARIKAKWSKLLAEQEKPRTKNAA